MSRLLFAASRGARVQVQLGPDRGWINSTQLTWHDDCVYRIHPDQLEFQYGPISTALREMAASGKAPATLSGLLAREAYEYEWVYPEAGEDHDNYTCLFLLILAEALADEGL